MVGVQGGDNMYDYLIWLKGGQCIEGTASEQELDNVVNNFYYYKVHKIRGRKYRFYDLKDTEGSVFIDLKAVNAIAVNAPIPVKNIGFIINKQNAKV